MIGQKDFSAIAGVPVKQLQWSAAGSRLGLGMIDF